ncbi:MAG: PstS family phosphate ABC transporter substrate-binding protein [Candidatus Thiodiazotropha sp. (ex Lucinoma borealis)]|nr:PstS family phosphate ABC transporter substrate-binding protein [Candidatus Thiodiazotropha sp. (ex Lucinoma borealis)]MCU7865736.1 PstS family phosphate ABC transporter substrate-binding protein [Candidatus Thiodiazotropha sp. (ex Lucinoma borealis)]MCU7868610.1 PstS family phosphate ABC transporter substrate-binding protein [Candidatus Thiodiazotropha sp. (ex Lucinoma borealis)]
MKRKLFSAIPLATTTLLLAITAQAADRTVIQNKGSDTLVNVAQAWAEAYRDVDSNIAVAVSGGGSGTGIAAMINGTVDIANASRKMKSKEIKLAKEKGQDPIEHVVGYDALAVFVHKDNPANSFSYDQLKSVFSRGGKATKWSHIGLKVPGCGSDEIVVVSRQNNSGTYAYFKKAVLGKKGKFRQGTLDMHGSKDVVDLVEKTPCAIGYSGLAYATDHIKMACIEKETGDTCINPSVETASDRSYPIARPLFMYTNGEPAGAIKTYLDWVKSDIGQCILLKKGYAPNQDVNCS